MYVRNTDLWVLNILWSLTPDSNKAPHSHLLTLFHGGMRIEKVKVRKLVDCDKDTLIGKAQAMHTGKAK